MISAVTENTTTSIFNNNEIYYLMYLKGWRTLQVPKFLNGATQQPPQDPVQFLFLPLREQASRGVGSCPQARPLIAQDGPPQFQVSCADDKNQ